MGDEKGYAKVIQKQRNDSIEKKAQKLLTDSIYKKNPLIQNSSHIPNLNYINKSLNDYGQSPLVSIRKEDS